MGAPTLIESFPIVDLSATSVEDAVLQLPLSRCYTLRCGKGAFYEAHRLYMNQACRMKDNPLTPFLNVELCPSYSSSEWSIHILGSEEYFWSPGV